MNVLIWFKRDLRAEDHPALAMAASKGPVLPVYIVDPEDWAQGDRSGRHWCFTAECLAELREALALLGLPLIVRSGDSVTVLDRLVRAHGITEMVSHTDSGSRWSRQRDSRVADWARSCGLRWTQLPDSSLCPADQPPDLRDLRAVPGVEPGAIPTARALRLAEDACPHRQPGGRVAGLAALDSFLTLRGAAYRTAMAAPPSAERACSRLSAHLSHGTLSLSAVVQATAARQAERPGGPWTGSLRAFQTRLALRETAMQAPTLPAPQMRADRLPEDHAARLSAWERGETGLPYLDACLRYLRATGWLPFRARAMVMASAAQHLALDPLATGTLLARRFTDYEPALHWPQVHQLSHPDTMATPRLYDPVKQGLAQDPTGAFTRRWVPELAAVPDALLQEPWKWSGAARLLGQRYPEPLVDVGASTRAARAALCLLRRQTGQPPRLSPRLTPRPAQDRPLPRPRQGSTAQLSLDL